MAPRVSGALQQVSNEAGTLYVVATPIGNMADITLRALEVLSQVDLIAAEDTRQTGKLLRHHGITNVLVSLHEHNEDEQSGRLLLELANGRDLALVSDAGTPLISDPGYPLVVACRERGIPVSPVPGANALIAALSVGGLPADRFRFEGFAPRRPTARLAWIESWSKAETTTIFYESCHRIGETLNDLIAVLGPVRRIVVARELTKRFETLLTGELGVVAARVDNDPEQHRGEFVVLIAGADATPDRDALDRTLQLLLAELPLRQAADLAARLQGVARNLAYRRALELQRQDQD